jgi:hypothetical protein
MDNYDRILVLLISKNKDDTPKFPKLIDFVRLIGENATKITLIIKDNRQLINKFLSTIQKTDAITTKDWLPDRSQEEDPQLFKEIVAFRKILSEKHLLLPLFSEKPLRLFLKAKETKKDVTTKETKKDVTTKETKKDVKEWKITPSLKTLIQFITSIISLEHIYALITLDLTGYKGNLQLDTFKLAFIFVFIFFVLNYINKTKINIFDTTVEKVLIPRSPFKKNKKSKKKSITKSKKKSKKIF